MSTPRSAETNMAFGTLLVAVLFVVLSPTSGQCPRKCVCTSSGTSGKPDFKKIVDCSGKLGDSDGIPWNIPTDTTHLDLKNNGIEQLAVGQFKTLTNLVKIDLSNNRLTTITAGVFNFAPGLKELYLGGNQLTCDCKLYSAFNASLHVTTFTGSCYKPDKLRGRTIKSLKLWDFCRGCASVKASQGVSADGEYSMEISANCDTRVRLFCHGMQSDAPKEYVTLLSGPVENFAYIYDYKQPPASKDDCAKASGGSTYSEAGLTNFTKVRLDLNTMTVIADDFLYSNTSSGKPVKFGEAADCYSASKESCRKGRLRIDLTGTGFRLQEGVYWEHYGIPSDISNNLDIDEDRRRVFAECGGYCGGCRAHGGKIALELDYCPQEGIKDCYKDLGMEDGTITNNQITASSFRTDGSKEYQPFYGRLNNLPAGNMGGAWCAAQTDSSQFLQVDLGKEMTLSGVATQGQSDEANWVTRYAIKHSKDKQSWNDYAEFGLKKDFAGNSDQHNVVTNWFNQRFRARYVRINPKLFSSPSNRICLRAELYGCDIDIVSVVIRSTTTKNCWSLLTSSNPCEPAEGTLLSLQSFCQGEGAMMAFRRDGTLIHSCSGKCVYSNAQRILALRDGPCDTFTKRVKPGGALVLSNQASGLCVNLDASSQLLLSDCSTETTFEFTQSGLQPIKPKFKVSSPQYLSLNKPGWVHCKVVSDPRAKVFWCKERIWPYGDVFNKLDFVQFSNGSLLVRKAKKSDEGNYYCNAVNSGGFSFKDVDVKVGEPPQLVIKPKNTSTVVNRTAMFNCKATSNLIPKVSWFQHTTGSPTPVSVAKLDKRFNVYPNGSLEIKLVQKNDEAFYECRAENPVGFNNVTVFLRVLVPPRFTIIPRGAAEPSGSSPVFNCQATGDPAPTISWSKGGSDLPLLKNGSLVLRNIQKSAEGRYVCAATSSLAVIRKEIVISVYVACRIDSQPRAHRQPDRQFFAVGEKVVVRCKPGFETKDFENLTCLASGNWDKTIPQCVDIDECLILASLPGKINSSNIQRCHEKARCLNTPGSYKCQCIEGYDGTGFTCTAVCLPPKNQTNSEWTPKKPTYQIDETVWLQCKQGFKLTAAVTSSVTCGKDTQWSTPTPSCQDTNECEDSSPCHETADCINTVGSYTCKCKEGYEGDGIEECKEEKKRFVTSSAGKAWKYSAKMDVLDEKIKQFEQNNLTTEELLGELKNSSSPSNGQLLPGDLLLTVKGLKATLSKVNPGQEKTVAKQILQVSSNLLNKRNKDQWNELAQDSKGVTDVITQLDDFAMMLANDLEKDVKNSDNATVEIKEGNIEMKVEVKEARKFSSDVQYPENTQRNNEGWAKIVLPKELFNTYEGDTLVKVTSFYFRDLAELMPKRGDGFSKFDVSSPIVSSSLSPVPSGGKLDPPVTITLGSEKPTEKDGVPKCVFWDFEKNKELGGSWSAEGCHVVSSASDGMVCECDHLTSFASLSVYDKELVLTLIIYIGCGILLLAVLIALIRHFYIYCKRHAERSIIHINLCIAIAAGIALFLGGLKLTKVKVVCIVVAALLQYFFIAMFCWIVCEALQLFMTITSGKNKNASRLKYFYVIGWIFPLVAVGISLGVTQLNGYGNNEWCWLDYSDFLMWLFVGPAAGFILVSFVLLFMILMVKGRVVDSADRKKICLLVLCLFCLIPVMAGTWVLAAIYVKHHENNVWQYVFAGACALQGILLLVYCLLNQEIKNFTFHYQIKKIQNKEKRNYYSTTDTVQYYGADAADGSKNYTVTRPSIKESNQDLRGSSKRLSRIGSTTGVYENEPEYPSPILDTPAHMDSAMKRNIEGEPIPDTPGGDVIHLHTFPLRKGSSSQYSSVPSEAPADRRPDGAEEPDSLFGDRRSSKSSMRRSQDTLLSSHSKLQPVPEREPLMNQGYPRAESPYSSEARARPYEVKSKSPFEEDSTFDSNNASLESSRRKSRRSRRRLEEEFGKSDREAISQRKRSLRYSSGFFSGATVEKDSNKVDKPHASL